MIGIPLLTRCGNKLSARRRAWSFLSPSHLVTFSRVLLTAWLLGLLTSCQALRVAPQPEPAPRDPPPALPGRHSFRLSQFVFVADFEIRRDLPLFQDLALLRDQVHRELHLPTVNTLVQVYLFEDRDKYERFLQARYPDLPKRRAFFVAQPRGNVGTGEDFLVYTYWGERIQQDLRHELTHALLHSVLKDVPLWLDEGLAEYFEIPPDWLGVNPRHLHYLRPVSGPAPRPDLERLELLTQVQHMTPADYREAWAWVHLMLRGRPEARPVLLTYLQALRSNPNPGPLAPRLREVLPNLNEALARHLDQLQAEHLQPEALEAPTPVRPKEQQEAKARRAID